MQNRLKELRKNKGLSQKEFATAFNKFMLNNSPVKDANGKTKKISYATVSRWENEQTLIPAMYFKSLADFFNVSISYLQGDSVFDEASILKLLNDSYFSEFNENFDTIVTPVKTCAKLKEIPVPEEALSQQDQKEFNKKTALYWAENYGFIFGDFSIKLLIGRPDTEHFTENAKELIKEAIQKECLLLSATPISEAFKNKENVFEQFNEDKDALLRLGSKKEIKHSITKLIKSLSEFRSELRKLPENENKYNLDWEDFSH